MHIAYRAKDITEAHIVAGLLNANGIETHVGGLYLQGAMGEIGAAGFSNVYVADEDLYPARQLVAEYEASNRASPTMEKSDDRPNAWAHWFLLAMVFVLIWLSL